MNTYEITVVLTVRADDEQDAREEIDGLLGEASWGGDAEILGFTIQPGREVN